MTRERARRVVRQSDIAQIVGVSSVTVSNALGGRKGVSDSLRTEILRVADELGYTQEQAEEQKQVRSQPSVARRNIYRLGLCFAPDYGADPKRAFHTVLENWPPSGAIPNDSFVTLPLEGEGSVEDYVAAVRDAEVEGMLSIGVIPEDYVRAVKDELQLPWVMLDGTLAPGGDDSLRVDAFRAGFTLTETLMQQGHERIGLLLDPPLLGIAVDFYLGYTKAYLDAGRIDVGGTAELDEQVVFLVNDTATIPRALLIGEEAPTAWVLADKAYLSFMETELKRVAVDQAPAFGVLANAADRLSESEPSPLQDAIVCSYSVDRCPMLQRAVALLRRRIQNPNRTRQEIYYTGEHQVQAGR